MINELKEESLIFFSVLRWFILACIIGVLAGLGTTLFLKLLDLGNKLSLTWNYYYLLLPLAMFLCIILINRYAPQAAGHGTEKVIEAVHQYSGRMDPLVVPAKLFTTVITIITGGSLGKEGPSAQIGAGLASIFPNIFKLTDSDRKKLVICGISAGFAAIGLVGVLSGSTNAPLAASIMALEMFGPVIGSFAAISCVISYIITGHRSVYSSQIPAMKKSSYINIELGKRIEKLEMKYEFDNPENNFHLNKNLKKIIKFLLMHRFPKK